MEWEETTLEEGRYVSSYCYTAGRAGRRSENKDPRREEWGSTVCDISKRCMGIKIEMVGRGAVCDPYMDVRSARGV